jgi:nicotinate-nucleotide adenylyltransferase
MGRIGIFGGTFDPPHLGHLILASEVRYQLRLDRLLWVLTPAPPHKPDRPITPLHHRLAMVAAALSDAPDFELSSVEIDRSPPHYAIDTVRLLRTQFPGDALIFLMGGDSLRTLGEWHQAEALVAELDGIGVMRRPEDQVDLKDIRSRLPGVAEKTHIVLAPLLDIASSDIRKRVREGAPYRYYVHPAVFELIRTGRIYLRDGLSHTGSSIE